MAAVSCRTLALVLCAAPGVADKIVADGPVYAVAWNPDGRSIAAGGRKALVDIWDVSSGTRSMSCEGHAGFIESVAYSADGSRIASASDDASVRIWDTSCNLLHTLKGHSDVVHSVVWRPDGSQLASGSDDFTVRIWDSDTGVPVRTLDGPMDLVLSVAYGADGTLACGDADGGVRIWSSDAGEVRWVADEAHDAEVNSVAFSPDAAQLVSAGSDGFLRVWNAATGAQLSKIKGETSLLLSISYSPNGARFAVSDASGGVTVYDASMGAKLQSFAHKPWTRSVAYGPSAAQLASGSDDGTIGVWHAKALFV